MCRGFKSLYHHKAVLSVSFEQELETHTRKTDSLTTQILTQTKQCSISKNWMFILNPKKGFRMRGF